MPTTTDDRPYIVTHVPQVLIVLSLILLSVFGWLGWTKVYNNPHRVFDDMLKNNLSTSSITRVSKTESQSSQTKTEQISFVPQMAVRTITSIDQKSDAGDIHVQSETIGTLTQDYSRYISVKTTQKNAEGKNLDYSKVLNIWGKSDNTQGAPQYMTQSLVGLIPFANLNAQSSQKILDLMNSKKVYEVQYNDVKPKKINGKSALVFPLKINTVSYIETLQAITKELGVKEIPNLNPADYKGQPPIEITVTVDKLSRQMIEAAYQGQTESYSSYGLTTPITIPNKTIPAADLQQKVQDIK